MAIHLYPVLTYANSYWQMGHSLLLASTSIAHDGHSLVLIKGTLRKQAGEKTTLQ